MDNKTNNLLGELEKSLFDTLSKLNSIVANGELSQEDKNKLASAKFNLLEARRIINTV